MEKLIILSDLWGTHNSDWLTNYTLPLSKYFEIKYYDCRKLGNIPLDLLDGEFLHNSFINGGINNAVEKLLLLGYESSAILGFSIGGYIAWKACLGGLKTQRIFAVSSTRLRFETLKPPAEVELFYGENDKFQPDEQWFHKMKLKKHIYKHEQHNMYLNSEIAQDVCARVIKHTVTNR